MVALANIFTTQHAAGKQAVSLTHVFLSNPSGNLVDLNVQAPNLGTAFNVLSDYIPALDNSGFDGNAEFLFSDTAGVNNESKRVTFDAMQSLIEDTFQTNSIINKNNTRLDVDVTFADFFITLNPDINQRSVKVRQRIGETTSDLLAVDTKTDTGTGQSRVESSADLFIVTAATAQFLGASFTGSINTTENATINGSVNTNTIKNIAGDGVDMTIADADSVITLSSTDGTNRSLIYGVDFGGGFSALLGLQTGASGGSPASRIDIDTGVLDVSSNSFTFTGNSAVFSNTFTASGTLRASEMRNNGDTSASYTINSSTTQRTFDFVSNYSGGSAVNLIRMGTRSANANDKDEVVLRGDLFQSNSTENKFINNVKIERSDSSINVAYFLSNTFYAASNITNRNSIISQYFRNNTSELYDGGRLEWKKTDDYTSAASAETEMRAYNCVKSSGNEVVWTSSANGNFTLKTGGTYSPFTGTHYVRYLNHEKMPGFKSGKIVEVLEAIPDPNNLADNDYRVNICNTIQSKRVKFVLLREKEIVIDADAIYSDDEETRTFAEYDLQAAKNNNVDFVKINNIDKVIKNNGKPKKATKPLKINQKTYTYYIYEAMAVGEEACLVCDSNGNIEAGDYLESFEDGYAQKSDSEVVNKAVLAKCAGDVDFSVDFETVQINGAPRRVKLAPIEM